MHARVYRAISVCHLTSSRLGKSIIGIQSCGWFVFLLVWFCTQHAARLVLLPFFCGLRRAIFPVTCTHWYRARRGSICSNLMWSKGAWWTGRLRSYLRNWTFWFVLCYASASRSVDWRTHLHFDMPITRTHNARFSVAKYIMSRILSYWEARTRIFIDNQY